MNNINSIPAPIYASFEKAAPKFLVVCIIKTQNGQFQFQSFHVASLEELYFQIAPESLVRHKVFQVGEVYPEVEGKLKQIAQEHEKAKKAEMRFQQYLELKKEFEQISIPEIK